MKTILLYTMDGCPHCVNFKNMLNENKIVYDERNIRDHEKEYKQFVEATGNEFLPAFTLVEMFKNEEPKISLNAPDDSFKTIEEALKLVKDFISE
jgi:glutaredoxin